MGRQSEVMVFRCSPEVKQMLFALGEYYGMSGGAVIRRLIFAETLKTVAQAEGKSTQAVVMEMIENRERTEDDLQQKTLEIARRLTTSD